MRKVLGKRHVWEIKGKRIFFLTSSKNTVIIINALLPRDNDRIIMATIKGDRRAKSKSSSRNSSRESNVNGS